ncbi:peptidoglycan-binding protein [Myxococcota bacterium]|nr:peptidoglycan-binding protein [Myxococcota bacterium]
MPEVTQVHRAKLQEITWDEDREVSTRGEPFEVQFNPETLKVTFSNQRAGNDQAGGGSVQYVGSGTTKLAVEMVFDVTVPRPPSVDGAVPNDVRRLTRKVAHFMIPERDGDNFSQRGLRFQWGTFLFEGVMDSMNETLELFSSDGRPLRALVQVEMSQQEIRDFATTPSGTPGATPTRALAEGQSIQSAAAADGRPADWRRYADAAGVENPRLPPAGIRVQLPPRGR